MSKKYCSYLPDKGENLFKQLREQFGYKKAVSIFYKASNKKFMNAYKDTLSFDAEGIPTYESLMKNPYIKRFIGNKAVLDILNSKYEEVDDTRENFTTLIQTARAFNVTDENRDKYIATVEYTDSGNIKVKIQEKTSETINKFNEQYGTLKLNNTMINLFGALGVNVDNLTLAEVQAGRVGVTDFSIAKNIASGFVSMIKIANNMEGAMHLPEEFAHLILGIFKDEPLVQRMISNLSSNEEALKQILGDEYNDVYSFYDGNLENVAEEAMGKLLQKNLLNPTAPEIPNKSLFKRFINWLKSKFRSYDYKDVQKVINDTEVSLSSMAQDIINGTTKITQNQIKNAQREIQFNALSSRIERNIEILKESAKVEAKRYKIASDKTAESAIKTKELMQEMLSYADDETRTEEGLYKYTKTALDNLKVLSLQFDAVDDMELQQKFIFFRRVKNYIDSYAKFINSLYKAIPDEKAEPDNMFLKDYDGTTLKSVLKDLNDLSKELTQRYSSTALPAFAEFLKPIFGEEIVVPFGRYAGTTMSVEDILTHADGDISFLDRWLDSMGNSSDTMLQLFNGVVMKQKKNIQLNTINAINEIKLFREECENKGIKDFSWAYEVDLEGNKTGYYISEVNYGQYEKDLKEFEEALEEKYGKNPTGAEAKAKIQERKEWHKEHSEIFFGKPEPNPEKYKNKAYDRLSKVQKEMLEKGLNIKAIFDDKLPKGKTTKLKAIQIRKDSTQRLLENVTSPNKLFDNIKESVKETFLDVEDDDNIFGNSKETRGLVDFNNREFMTVPALYVNTLKNPNELSDDFIASLMSYAYSINNYSGLSEIVDAMEVGRDLVTNPDIRKVDNTRGGNPLIERFRVGNFDIRNKSVVTKTNIEKKLDDFFESQIYGRYLKDQGSVKVPFTKEGHEINVNKAVSFALKWSSLAQLGFNWLSNIANVTTGLGMQNIEAVAGQYFTIKNLGSADKAYASNIVQLIAESKSLYKENKLSLFFDLFDVKQDFAKRVSKNNKSELIRRFLGTDIAFLGQELGDHWLYGRTALAMAMKEQVLLNGKKMSLWDALQVKSVKRGSKVKELNYRDITDLEGRPFDVGVFSRRIAKVNHDCFGVYNDDDLNAANRVAMGRLLQQYRKWLRPALVRRFKKGHWNQDVKEWEEGYYRTVGRTVVNIVNGLRKGQWTLAAEGENLTEEEKYNLKRAMFEMAQFLLVAAFAYGIDWPDDNDEPWYVRYANYFAKRLEHELGTLAPSPVMIQELLKTFKQPLPILNQTQNIIELLISIFNPNDWFDEIQSGNYAGQSTLTKNWMKAPVPIISQMKQIDKFTGDLDESIQFYARAY